MKSIAKSGAPIYYMCDLANHVRKLTRNQELYLLKNTKVDAGNAKYLPYFIVASCALSEALPLVDKKAKYLTNEFAAERLDKLIPPYTPLLTLETEHGLALVFDSPQNNVMTFKSVSTIVDERMDKELSYSRVVVTSVKNKQGLRFVLLLDNELSDEDYYRFDADQDGDWGFPIGVVTDEVYRQLADHYSAGSIGSMEDPVTAYRHK